jgi:hypothetical protein
MAKLLNEVDFSRSELGPPLNPGGGGVREVKFGPSSLIDRPAKLILLGFCPMIFYWRLSLNYYVNRAFDGVSIFCSTKRKRIYQIIAFPV